MFSFLSFFLPSFSPPSLLCFFFLRVPHSLFLLSIFERQSCTQTKTARLICTCLSSAWRCCFVHISPFVSLRGRRSFYVYFCCTNYLCLAVLCSMYHHNCTGLMLVFLCGSLGLFICYIRMNWRINWQLLCCSWVTLWHNPANGFTKCEMKIESVRVNCKVHSRLCGSVIYIKAYI